MKLSYEKACIEAGLPEEKIKEIRKVFNDSYNSMSTEIRRREKNGISRISISGMTDYEEIGDYEIEDKSADLEHNYFLDYDFNVLNEVMAQLTNDERKFIMMYFDDACENVSAVARMANIPRTTATYRITRILDDIREKFFELNPGKDSEFFK